MPCCRAGTPLVNTRAVAICRDVPRPTSSATLCLRFRTWPMTRTCWSGSAAFLGSRRRLGLLQDRPAARAAPGEGRGSRGLAARGAARLREHGRPRLEAIRRNGPRGVAAWFPTISCRPVSVNCWMPKAG